MATMQQHAKPGLTRPEAEERSWEYTSADQRRPPGISIIQTISAAVLADIMMHACAARLECSACQHVRSIRALHTSACGVNALQICRLSALVC